MERVVKRFLMHNQGDSDDPKQNEFDDLKQDLQLLKYDMLNDLKKSREDNMRNMFIINGGIQFLAEEILSNNINKDNLDSAFARYRELLNNHHNMLKSENETVFVDHATSGVGYDRQLSDKSMSDKQSADFKVSKKSIKFFPDVKEVPEEHAAEEEQVEEPVPKFTVPGNVEDEQQQQPNANSDSTHTVSPNNVSSFFSNFFETPMPNDNMGQSPEDFFQNRLAYDFHATHDDE
mgnify:CR=1 FL=1